MPRTKKDPLSAAFMTLTQLLPLSSKIEVANELIKSFAPPVRVVATQPKTHKIADGMGPLRARLNTTQAALQADPLYARTETTQGGR